MKGASRQRWNSTAHQGLFSQRIKITCWHLSNISGVIISTLPTKARLRPSLGRVSVVSIDLKKLSVYHFCNPIRQQSTLSRGTQHARRGEANTACSSCFSTKVYPLWQEWGPHVQSSTIKQTHGYAPWSPPLPSSPVPTHPHQKPSYVSYASFMRIQNDET